MFFLLFKGVKKSQVRSSRIELFDIGCWNKTFELLGALDRLGVEEIALGERLQMLRKDFGGESRV